MYVRPVVAARELGISTATLRSYAKQGCINFITTAGGQRRYDIQTCSGPNKTRNKGHDNILRYNQQQQQKKTSPTGAIYARVSSHKQKDDLQRQIQALQAEFPDYQVFQDICSGLKYKRKGLSRLLEQVQAGTIQEVVVAHKDRLARFATEIIEWVITRAGGTLRILNHDKLSPEQELTEDLMAIVHVFSCRLNGKRKYRSTQQTGENTTIKSLQGDNSAGEGSVETGFRSAKKTKRQTMSIDPITVETTTA